MEYVTVFDASQKGLDWWAPVFGTSFALIGLHALLRRRDASLHGMRRVGIVLYILFGLGIATLPPLVQSRHRTALIAALREGRAAVVEGRVQDFVPMPWSGHARECFTLQETRFCYSDFAVSAGFNNTRSHGGPLREGLQVRVHHVDRVIARLEVAKGQGTK